MSSVRDILVICIILFVVGVALTFIVSLSHTINATLLNVTTINSSTSASNVIYAADVAIDKSDYLFLALMIALTVSVIIFGYLIGGTPILAPIYFFILIIFGFVGVVLQLVWNELGTNSFILMSVVNLPITNYILTHLGYFTVVIGLLGIVSLFAKPTDQVGY